MSGKTAVFADVHGNHPALVAVLTDAESRGVEGCCFLGDAVGYGPEPHRCVELLASVVAPEGWVLGNHDAALLALASCRGDLEKGGRAQLESQLGSRSEPRRAIVVSWELLRLFPERLANLAAQPLEARWEDCYLVHGGLRHDRPTTTGIRHPPDARDELNKLVDLHGEEAPSTLLVGHTHRPIAFYRPSGRRKVERVALIENREVELDEHRWVLNPGSVGQPRDGDPRAAYLLLDADAGTAQLCRVEYDIATTQRRMADLSLPVNLIDRLSTGR